MAAAEGFFVHSEAVPGVIMVGGGGDTPKIVELLTVFLGVENHLDEDDGAGGKFAMFKVGGGVSIIAGVVVVVNKGGGDGIFG